MVGRSRGLRKNGNALETGDQQKKPDKKITATRQWNPLRAEIQRQSSTFKSDWFYCVIVFARSPSLKPAPEMILPTPETSSTSVSSITPTGAVRRRMTWFVAGSLISRL